MRTNIAYGYLLILVIFGNGLIGSESLSQFLPSDPPTSYASMWHKFDPSLEPIETEIIKEWEQDEVLLRIIRYRIGVFKGKKAMMAGIYGFPKGQEKIPGLLQVHGGGQYAHHNAVITNAKRGYATLSIAWAGRLSAPGYHVGPNEVKLFWEGQRNDPKYKLTTDWGALDAYHAPSRYGKDAFPTIPAYDWSIDPVKSPRNNSWFLITLAGRRGLTFLERQPEVDPSKLGVYGHSMGGKLTVMISGSDQRVKAAVPSCGGISDRYSEDDMHLATVSDPPSLEKVNAPIMFLSPSNDFHGRINDLGAAIREIKSSDWRVSISPHHNHQDTAEFEVGTQLWFDQHLKGGWTVPQTPDIEWAFKNGSFPKLLVRPDPSREIKSVEIYFTQQGVLQKRGKAQDDSQNTKHRFWKFVNPAPLGDGKTWEGELPLFDTNRSVWAFANVHYEMDSPIAGSGYYYGSYETKIFNLSSLPLLLSAEELKKWNVKVSEGKNGLVESFSGTWEKDWFSYNTRKWGIRTNKLYEPHWAPPSPSARLSLEIRSDSANKMVLWIDGHGCELDLLGNDAWQRFSFPASALKNAEGKSLPGWSGIRELRLDDSEKLVAPRGSSVKPLKIGAAWQGSPPQFRNLSWIK
jgi:hypothetical protein